MGRRAENALSTANRVLLAAAVAIGAFLRFDRLGVPSYWLDEVLDALFSRDALNHPWWHWLTGFGREHGPLHFAIQLATQLLRDDEFAGRLPAALCGIATIVLAYVVAHRFDARAAGLCALLVATSPFHVYYSREARPYALLMLLAVALLLAIMRGSAVAVAIVSVLALYTSAIAAALVAATALAAAIRRQWKIALVAVAIAAAFPLLYRSNPEGTGAIVPHIDVPFMARAFTVSALGENVRGHTVLALLVFAAIGAVAMLRREPRTGAVAIVMTLVPMTIVCAVLVVTKHFFALRYLAFALPPFLLLAAIGIATIVRPRFLAPLVVIAVMTQTWTAARTEPFRKLDWRAIAHAISSRAQPGDTVLTADPVADIVLRHYLRDVPHGLKIASVPYVDVAKVVVATRPAVWIATTYNTTDFSVREWSCGFPLLLASDLEGFRLHFAASPARFLRERAIPADLRALGSIDPLVLRPGTNDELFVGEGWAAADHVEGRTYRWATALTATLVVPRSGARDRVLTFNALPVARQSMTVLINGVVLGRRELPIGWHEHAFDAPAPVWREGLNTITLTFARTEIVPNDPRPLAVLFESIAIRNAATRATQSVSPIPPPRITALVDWPGRTKYSARAPADFLARAGLDPTIDAELGDAARTIAWGPECEDDRTFLHRAFAAIVQREPNPAEKRDLMERMRRGTARSEIVTRILQAL